MRTHSWTIVAIAGALLWLAAGAAAEDARIEPGEDAELEELREAAQTEAGTESAQTQERPSGAFQALGLALQALNPQISVSGDLMGYWRQERGERGAWSFLVRALEIQLDSYLDPYTKFKAVLAFAPELEASSEEEGEEEHHHHAHLGALGHSHGGAELEEIQVTRLAVLPGVNLVAGRFRQRFGTINRWHQHALDEADYPLPLRAIFGDHGLAQTGLSIEWTLPRLWASYEEITLQITNGENERLFTGNIWSVPSGLAHWKNFWDLSKDAHFEIGFSGLLGASQKWTVLTGLPDPETEAVVESHLAGVVGADLSLVWEPTGAAKYANVEWRAEGFLAWKEVLAPTRETETIRAWGAFTSLTARVSRTFSVGIRADFFKPDGKNWAWTEIGETLAPLAATHDTAWRGLASVHVTWQESEFVKVRLEYDYADGHRMGEPEHTLMLSLIFEAGPHRHEKY
ncbi:MAG: hypothetical protein HY900_11910 [Deltaproteobacteria bacterium]|nr:hypothetical protein [Deltaproteobacteria bacterium]